VGVVTDLERKTGCTVLVVPEGSRGAVDVAGGAPATRETPVLDPDHVVPGPDAILLTGGSAYGLRAADGVMAVLAEAGRGVAVGAVRVPIVVGAAIFDLDGPGVEAPTVADGERAARAALAGGQAVPEGRAGAGTGATVGKSLGREAAMPGGQGAVTLTTADGLVVAAVVVVNAVGSVVDDAGRVLAGPRLPDGTLVNTTDLWAEVPIPPSARAGEATTIGAVLTNARLDKPHLVRVCRMAHDGLARAVDPVHTPWDGDTLFAVSVGDKPADLGRVGALAARAVAAAVRRAVKPPEEA
jgi:L-aminopeptidase/D-esterase-like protein